MSDWLRMRGWQVADAVVCPCCESVIPETYCGNRVIHVCRGCGYCPEEDE